MLVYSVLAFSLQCQMPVRPVPQVTDDQLILESIAVEPDIMTPTGVAIDSAGRVLVIESHTHFPPDDYPGPKTDRILCFKPAAPPAVGYERNVFFEGSIHTMNLGVHPNGGIYVATRSEIFRLDDADNNGVAEKRTNIAKLEGPGDYPHDGLSGFAFDWNGDLLFGLGENLGAVYKLVGTDGSFEQGGGEGGSIFRSRPDGSQISREATGFWNPFHVCYDAFGRLFAVDNDPDSRPPCRLLHIVVGGDYGYRFRNGRAGLHPFTAWNGELPGTLPMMAGTGEAPSGIVAYESDNLPSTYRGMILGTSWGDHRIQTFTPHPKGASLESVAKTLVQGGEDFRPVGIAQAFDGSLYISDWVDKSYTLHRKGGLWRLRSRSIAPRVQPASPVAALAHPDSRVREEAARSLLAAGPSGIKQLTDVLDNGQDARARMAALVALLQEGKLKRESAEALSADPDEKIASFAVRAVPADWLSATKVARATKFPSVKAAALRRIAEPGSESFLLEQFRDLDPFIRQAAREGLRHSVSVPRLLELAKSAKEADRLNVLLLLRAMDTPETRVAIPEFLGDSSPEVRFATVQWISDSRLTEFRGQIEKQLALPATTQAHFSACLAALSRLDQPPDTKVADVPGYVYALPLIAGADADPAAIAQALRIIPADHEALTLERLDQFLASPDPRLQREAIRSLRESKHMEKVSRLKALALDRTLPQSLRGEAIVGLATQNSDPAVREELVRITIQETGSLRDEALRSLRRAELSPDQKQQLAALSSLSPATTALLETVLNPGEGEARPPGSDRTAWNELLTGTADAESGARIFFHPNGPGCYRCHAMDGRGGMVGPELSSVSGNLDRQRILDSILEPSAEIAPRFVPWTLALANGEVKTGLLVTEWVDGDQTYADSQGNPFRLHPGDIAERHPSPKSIMPEDLSGSMTLQEFRDLLAFLTKGPAP